MAIKLVKFAPNVDGIIEDLWPQLQALLHLAAATSWVKYHKPLILTSVWREALHDGDLHALNRKYGAAVRRKLRVPGPGTYLVAFAEVDLTLDTVPQAVESYKAEAASITNAEPDYIVHVLETIPNDPDFGQLWGLKNTGQAGAASASVSVLKTVVEAYPLVYSGLTPDASDLKFGRESFAFKGYFAAIVCPGHETAVSVINPHVPCSTV